MRMNALGPRFLIAIRLLGGFGWLTKVMQVRKGVASHSIFEYVREQN